MSTMPTLLFLAGSPGPLELLVIFGVVLVLFGPRKLPEIARSIGRMLHELRKASDDFRAQIMSIEDAGEKHPDEGNESPYDVSSTLPAAEADGSGETDSDDSGRRA